MGSLSSKTVSQPCLGSPPFLGDFDLRTGPSAFSKVFPGVSNGQSGSETIHCSRSLHSDPNAMTGTIVFSGYSGNRIKTLPAHEESHIEYTLIELTFIEWL